MQLGIFECSGFIHKNGTLTPFNEDIAKNKISFRFKSVRNITGLMMIISRAEKGDLLSYWQGKGQGTRPQDNDCFIPRPPGSLWLCACACIHIFIFYMFMKGCPLQLNWFSRDPPNAYKLNKQFKYINE